MFIMKPYKSYKLPHQGISFVTVFAIMLNPVCGNFLQLRADLAGEFNVLELSIPLESCRHAIIRGKVPISLPQVFDSASSNVSISLSSTQPPGTSTIQSLNPTITGVTSISTIDPDLATAPVSSGTISQPEASNIAFPQQCRTEDVGDFPPFCRPRNGTEKYVGSTYYVTWDVVEFTPNSTVTIILDYVDVNGTGPKAQHAWESKSISKNVGYITLQIDGDWLQGNSRNNLSLTMQSFDATADKPARLLKGPIIFLTNQPVEHYPPPPHNSIDKLGLEIGIPVGFFFCVLVVCGLWCGMRKHRRIGLGNVMGRKKGYGVGKSRRQRMGLKRAAFQVHDSEDVLPGSPVFRDDLTGGNIELQTNPAGYGS